MGIFSELTSFLASGWSNISDFITLIIFIIYIAIFFIAQYFLIKGYAWLFKNAYNLIINIKNKKFLKIKSVLNKKNDGTN